jgi:hypothetical protein
MAKKYTKIKVESYYDGSVVHVRPLPNQEPFLTTMNVASSKHLRENYPVGTKFILSGFITSKLDECDYIYTNPRDHYEVIK